MRTRTILTAGILFLLCGSLSASTAAGENGMAGEDSVGTVQPELPGLRSLVITEDDIRRSGALVLGEVLSWLPGLEVLDRGYLGSGKHLSFEGFPGDHLLIIIDGEMINNVSDGAFDINLIPLSAIERVEVTRHPSFLDRDSRASGGTINIRTKRYEGGDAFTRLTLAGGSYGTSYQEGLFRRGLLDDQVGLSIAFDRIATSGFEMEKDHKAFQYHFRIEDRAWESVELSVSGSGTKSSGALSNSDDTTSVDMEDEFHHFNIRAAFNTEGSLPLEFSGFFTHIREDSLARENQEPSARRRSERNGIRFKGLLRHVPGLIVSYGAQEEFSAADGGDDDRIFSLFTGAEYHPDGWPVVEYMGRWDREGSRFSEWSGGLTASYSLSKGTSVFASFIDARHIPPFTEGEEAAGNGRSRRERVVESGLEVELGGFQGSMTGFSRWSDPVDFDALAAPGSGASLEKRLGVSGLRIQTGSSVGRHLTFSVGYQGTALQNSPSGIAGLSIPKHHLTGRLELLGTLKEGKIGLSYSLAGNLVRGRNRGVSAGLSGDDNYGYVDMNTRFRIIDVTFFYTIRNAFDSGYEIVESFPMPGRVQRFGFRWDFFD